MINGAFIESYIHGGPAVQQYDGTVIGSGATAPGGWLRLAKEGGKHLLLSLEYTGAGRKLQYNDMGYMQRQNIQTVQASVGWRTLKPTRFTVDTTTSLVASDSRNMSGLELGQSYELNTRRAAARLLVDLPGGDASRPRGSTIARSVTAPRLQRAGYWGGKIEYDSDPRRSVYATIADQTQLMGGGIYATNVQGSLVFHALPQLDIEFLPQVTWAAGEYRYAWQAVTSESDPYWFGKLAAKNLSATLRVTYTFTPRLSLAGLRVRRSWRRDTSRTCAASGLNTSRQRRCASPGRRSTCPTSTRRPLRRRARRSPTLTSSRLPSTPTSSCAGSTGSARRCTWSTRVRRSRPGPNMFTPPATLSPRNFGHGATTDVVLLKLSYWWGS